MLFGDKNNKSLFHKGIIVLSGIEIAFLEPRVFVVQPDHLRDGYITLKEAAKISGYSADYIGQLIRKGKISGRQIYTNIAWVTTEDEIREYINREGKGKKGEDDNLQENFDDENELLHGSEGSHRHIERVSERMIRWLLYVSLAVGAICLLALFYLVSVSIDHHFNKNFCVTSESPQNRTLSANSITHPYARR